MNLAALETEILKVRSQDLSTLIPLRDDVEILIGLSIVVLVGLDIFSLLLPVPAKESQFDCLRKFIILLSFQSFFLISFLLLHDTFNVSVPDCPFFDWKILKALVSLDLHRE